MESLLFPLGHFDEPGVASLESNQKLLIGGAATHIRMTACGVIFLSDYVFSSLALLPSVGLHVAEELQRRGLVLFDKETRAYFNLSHFHWHVAAQHAPGSRWALAVNDALDRLPLALSNGFKETVVKAMAAAPARRLPSVAVPSNLLSALPAPGRGEKWTPSGLLVMLAMYTNPLQNDGGIFVVDYDAVGALCSLPALTVEQMLVTLDAWKALVFDQTTREVFLPVRMKNAKKTGEDEAFNAISNARARRVRHAAKQMFTKTFGQTFEQCRLQARTYVPKDVDLDVRKNLDVDGSGSGSAGAPPAASSLTEKGVSNNKEKAEKQNRRKIFGVTVCNDDEESELRELADDSLVFVDTEQVEKVAQGLARGGRCFLSQFRKWYLEAERVSEKECADAVKASIRKQAALSD